MKNTSTDTTSPTDTRTEIRAKTGMNFFSCQTLELTFRLLRQTDKALANSVKQALDNITDKRPEGSTQALTAIQYPNSRLLELIDAQTIGKIIACLTHIGEEALRHKNLPPTHIKQLRALIDDWAQLTDWVLQHLDKRYLNLNQTKIARHF